MNRVISKSSKIYAESLFQSSDKYSSVLEELKNISQSIKMSVDFQMLINNPIIPKDKKYEIIDELFREFDVKILNFIKLLINKNKLCYLDEVIEEYTRLIYASNNIRTVDITSAINLTDEWKNKILKKLEKKYNKSIKATWLVDKKIIGGLIIKSDDEIIDTSIKNKLYTIGKI